MEKINFINNQAPALNATNLNQLQTNIENAINSVVESGSNDNGSWIKYSDGTMICTKKVSGKIDMTTAWYTLYTGEFNLGSSPQTFISAPFVNYSMVGEYAFVTGTTKKPTTTSLGNVMLVRPSSLTNMPYEIDIIAIGKWK